SPSHRHVATPNGRGVPGHAERRRVRPDGNVAHHLGARRRYAVRKLGSVGKPVSTVAMRVVDSKLADVRPGEVGEAVYQGPTVMAGYWREPAATADAFHGGWFHSGDLVRVDEEGFIFVVDRVKDMIISGGENVECPEVENALAAHPAIAEVSVIGRPHSTWGETPVAVAALRPGATLDIATLRDW